MSNASREHLVPRSLGGGDNKDNIMLACKACNSSRANGSLIKFMRTGETHVVKGIGRYIYKNKHRNRRKKKYPPEVEKFLEKYGPGGSFSKTIKAQFPKKQTVIVIKDTLCIYKCDKCLRNVSDNKRIPVTNDNGVYNWGICPLCGGDEALQLIKILRDGE